MYSWRRAKSEHSSRLKDLSFVGLMLSLGACGSGGTGTTGTATSANSAFLAASTSSASNSLRVQILPAPTPNFDPSIHDYVVHCDPARPTQLTAWLSIGSGIELYGSDNQPIGQSPLIQGQFQASIPLSAGQRFRFTVQPSTVSEYSVRCLPADFPPLTATVTGTPQAEWYIFAPTIAFGNTLPPSYVIITDANGTPVWWRYEPAGPALDAKMLSPTEITWTVASKFGAGGQYVIRDLTGRVLNTLTGNLDEHELQVTPAGTFLAIRDEQRICPPDCADMSPWGGSAQAAVIDAEIIEIDKNSNVLWTWRTRDHIGLDETGSAGWFPGIGNDIIHMNALQPDGNDGVIFSARHLNAIYHITKSSGAIDWKVGGVTRPESLAVLGDTRPTATGPNGQVLSGQHDVRLWPDGTVSVHDDGTIANRPPYAVRYQIDKVARTADVVEEFTDSRVTYAICCGSARRLPNGHWFMDWGAAPFVTELDGNANPVLTIQYNLGTDFSYRADSVLPGIVSADTLRSGMDLAASN